MLLSPIQTYFTPTEHAVQTAAPALKPSVHESAPLHPVRLSTLDTEHGKENASLSNLRNKKMNLGQVA